MIAVPMAVMVAVEIAKDEKTPETESSPPERIWHPAVKIAIFPGGRVIAHDGRPVLFIILIHDSRINVFGNLRRRSGGA